MTLSNFVNNIDKSKRILEIGPLNNPKAKKNIFKNAFYADIKDVDNVKKYYTNINGILDIDFVIENSYTETFKDIPKFDYVIASHVIEHIPRLIHFFNDISSVLNTESFLCLSIPDKRFSFDYFRNTTSFAEAYYIHVNNLTTNPIAVLDYFSNVININDPNSFWQGNEFLEFYKTAKLNVNSSSILKRFEEASKGTYIDVHFSVFTPNSFLFLILNMIYCSLFPFSVSNFFYTKIDTLEFTVILKYNPSLVNKDGDNIRIQEITNIISILHSNLNIEGAIIDPKRDDIFLLYQLDRLKIPKPWLMAFIYFDRLKKVIKNNRIFKFLTINLLNFYHYLRFKFK
jgi:hypothetical protein